MGVEIPEPAGEPVAAPVSEPAAGKTPTAAGARPVSVPDRRRTIFFAVSAAVLVAILAVFREVLLPFILAATLAYVFAPVVDAMDRLRFRGRPMPRWVAVLVFYVALLATLVGLGALAAPRIATETQRLIQGMPRIVTELEREWVPRIEGSVRGAIAPYVGTSSSGGGGALGDSAHPHVESSPAMRVVPRPDGSFDVTLPVQGVEVAPQDDGSWLISSGTGDVDTTSVPALVRNAVQRGARWASQYAGEGIRAVQTFVRSLVRGVFWFFLTLMLSAYMLITKDRILAFFRGLVREERRESWDALLHRVDRGLSGVVRGQVIICLVNGVLSGIGFWLLGLDYWPVLALIATVFSIVPIFGSILSSVPVVIIALHQGVGTALLALAWIVGIHQLEANLLNPKIMGDAAKVHPVLVIFSLLAGEHLFGIAGAVLAVPTLSLLQSLFLHFRTVALGPAPASG